MSSALLFERLRRGFGRGGRVTVASTMPPAVEGRPDDYRLAPSRLIEGTVLATKGVGAPTPCPEPMAFLDGTQRYEVVGYFDTVPIVAALIAAAVRLRVNGRFTTLERAERRIVVTRQDVLAELTIEGDEFEPYGFEATEQVHPLKELENAHRAIDRARAGLERTVGARFRATHDDWLIVDGVISDAETWARDPKTIGISKSHATLPFDGPDLKRYLTLPAHHRTSVFEPAMWRFAKVHSWALRLWPYEGQDLLHGLVRVEVAESAQGVERADELSRWILAERVPLSRPDLRWDRLLYGVATVERHLRAR